MTKLFSLDPNDYPMRVNTKKRGESLEELERQLNERIKGQEEAIRHITRRLAIKEAGIRDPTRPIGAMVFAGPSGTGKTYTAKELARILIGQEKGTGRSPVTLIECPNLRMEHSIHSLIGAPPSYIGYKEKGSAALGQENIDRPYLEQIIKSKYEEAIARAEEIISLQLPTMMQHPAKPQMIPQIKAELLKALKALIAKHEKPLSIIVFDEVEKAHINVINLLLEVFEEGKLTMSDGSVTDFSNSFFILTSNVGSREIGELLEDKTIGFKPSSRQAVKKSNGLDQDIYEIVKKEFQKSFPREFVSRLRTEIIAFRTLKLKDYFDILDLLLDDVQKKFNGKDLGRPLLLVRYTGEFKNFLVNEGVDSIYGARVLRSVVERYVVHELSQAIVSKELRPGDEIIFCMEEGKPLLRRVKRSKMKIPLEFGKEEGLELFDIDEALEEMGFMIPKPPLPSPRSKPPASPPGRNNVPKGP